MPLCKMCGKDCGKLVKAHIIPRSFYKAFNPERKPSAVFLQANLKEIKQRLHQVGLYDKEILCENCERLFAPYDTHGYQVLHSAVENKKYYVDIDGNQCALIIPNSDYKLLKIFILSVLLRASYSKHIFFSKVNLGPHAELIKQIIIRGEVGDDYDIAFFHYHDAKYKVLHPPFKGKMEGVNVYRLYFPQIMVLIAMDKRPLHGNFQILTIRPNQPHYIAIIPFQGSTEARYLFGLAEVMRKHAK